MITDLDLAWFAGVLDVSGRIRMRKKESTGYEYPVLDLRAEEEVVLRFAEFFGGVTRTYWDGWKNRQYWCVQCSNAVAVLSQVRPFMQIRGELVDTLLAWQPKRKSWKEAGRKAIHKTVIAFPLNRWRGVSHGDAWDRMDRDDLQERAR